MSKNIYYVTDADNIDSFLSPSKGQDTLTLLIPLRSLSTVNNLSDFQLAQDGFCLNYMSELFLYVFIAEADITLYYQKRNVIYSKKFTPKTPEMLKEVKDLLLCLF